MIKDVLDGDEDSIGYKNNDDPPSQSVEKQDRAVVIATAKQQQEKENQQIATATATERANAKAQLIAEKTILTTKMKESAHLTAVAVATAHTKVQLIA